MNILTHFRAGRTLNEAFKKSYQYEIYCHKFPEPERSMMCSLAYHVATGKMTRDEANKAYLAIRKSGLKKWQEEAERKQPYEDSL